MTLSSCTSGCTNMENKCGLLQALMVATSLLISLIFMLNLSPTMAADEEITKQRSTQIYIVYVKNPPEARMNNMEYSNDDMEKWYASFLPDDALNNMESSEDDQQQPRMVYSYRHVASGFAARLTAEEVKAMEKKDGFISALPERIQPLQTTHSPEFLGLSMQEPGFWQGSNFGKGVIIGVLDSGILPSHPSFSDDGVPPPPAKWKGKCEFNGTNCNNKIIGARVFQAGTKITGPAQFDDSGHGTHTASTAAGNFVNDAAALWNAKGTAAGIAPYAHLAIYKICYNNGCGESDILAALDSAIDDGVDVISISIAGGPAPFYQDGLALGAFRAIQKGIFVSCSAGNSGPNHSTSLNLAPWILTVGASTIDRNIRATAKLGNGEEYDGESQVQPQDFNPTTSLPLVYAGDFDDPPSAVCDPPTLAKIDVKGKIVLCESGWIGGNNKSKAVSAAGGAAMIIMNTQVDGYTVMPDLYVIPGTQVSHGAGLKIKDYIKSTKAPTATILFKGTVIGGDKPSAPSVASFSSRGPNTLSPGIMKPDIIGPGVNIIAAWPVPVESNINSQPTFHLMSGTSMACPHLSGIAALLKNSHPDWSPAAIKSAIMTTADDTLTGGENPITDENLLPADILATGSGHVNPSKANDPGLVYDIHPDDYIPYLCGLNYDDQMVAAIVAEDIKCSEVKSIPEAQLNYPAFAITLGSSSDTQTYTRTVTNVGRANSTYSQVVFPPRGIGSINVTPAEMTFTEVNQTATYTVTFIPTSDVVKPQGFAEGYLIWVSDHYSVKSPISVTYV